MKRLLVGFMIILIIICVDLYLKRDTTTDIKIDKTYEAQVINCSNDIINFFELKDNQCIVKIQGGVKVFKDHTRFEFKGTVFINLKKYKFDDKNMFVSTKLQLGGHDVYMGTNDDHSSTYKNDEVTEYIIDIYHDENYNLKEIYFVGLDSKVGTLKFQDPIR